MSVTWGVAQIQLDDHFFIRCDFSRAHRDRLDEASTMKTHASVKEFQKLDGRTCRVVCGANVALG
ncbi:hypothetical protein V7S43_009852 [Phytophthora oleae]|uniref:Uncharacterized protein n=1 Tax=Phytophthora oleae TaxID=2107226 RepID=A0ABD3FJR9_9STRA